MTNSRLAKTLLIILLVSVLFDTTIRAWFVSVSKFKPYLQVWNSDYMMQTLPITDLRKNPLECLWYLHIQPPGFDALRAILAQFHRGDSPLQLLIHCDQNLYEIWTVLFALMSCGLFLWLHRSTSTAYALLATFFWIIHPSPLMVSFLLDGTLLSAACVLWFSYEWWRIGQIPSRTGAALAVSALLAYLVRTTFQWWFFPLVLLAMFLRKLSGKKIAVFALISLPIVGAFTLKQVTLFGTTSTTTFSGYHYCGILWEKIRPMDYYRLAGQTHLSYPARADQVIRNEAFNNKTQCTDNLVYQAYFREKVIHNPPLKTLRALWKSVRLNWKHFWAATFSYFGFNDQYLYRRLPWHGIYATIFSSWPYTLLVAGAIGLWIRRNKLALKGSGGLYGWAGFVLPFACLFCVLMLSNRYEWSEAERLKFFFEPLFFILIAQEIYFLILGLKLTKRF